MKKFSLLFSLSITLNLSSQTSYTLNQNVSTTPSNNHTVTTHSLGISSYTIPSGSYSLSFTYVSSQTQTLTIKNGTTTLVSTTLSACVVPIQNNPITVSYTISTPSNIDGLWFNLSSSTSSLFGINNDIYLSTLGNVGIDGLKPLEINFYSNYNSIYVDNIENIKIDVYNLSGELIYSDKVNSHIINLDVYNGVYLVKLSKNNQYSIKKMYIKNEN